MIDFTELSLRRFGEMLRAGELRLGEVVATAVNNDRLGAFREVDVAAARRWASEAATAIVSGAPVPPLAGVPISVKDLYGVPGYATYAGSPRPLPERFEYPGTVVRALIDQHAVITGKTHTVEFAFGGIGTTPHHPTPRNPWDIDTARAPGGSSAGAGVSLCEGSALLALGTDTAGSVRIPAAWTGNVALKTTKGRWPTDGIVPLSTTLDTPGILARTVEDLAYAFEALDSAVSRERDSASRHGGRHSVSCMGPHPWVGENPQLQDIRIGRCETLMFEECAPGVVEAVDGALGELASAGARVERFDLPEALDAWDLFQVGGPVAKELRDFLHTELPEWLETLDPNVRSRVVAAESLSAAEYRGRLDTMVELAASARQRLGEVDLLVGPTVANSPPALAALEDPDVYARENLLSLRNTSLVSYLGLCAVTLPVGLDVWGMPVGLHLVARGGDETRLLAIAGAFERVLGTPAERIGRAPGTSLCCSLR